MNESCDQCGAKAITSCRNCDDSLCSDCDVNPDQMNESICDSCLEYEENVCQLCGEELPCNCNNPQGVP